MAQQKEFVIFEIFCPRGFIAVSYTHLDVYKRQEELGDVLFAAVAVGRQSGIDCEELLAETCDRYIQADSEREAGQ